MERINTGNFDIGYKVKRNGKSKKVSFRFDNNILSIVCPSRVSDRQLKTLLNSNQSWLDDFIRKNKVTKDCDGSKEFSLYYFGKLYRVIHQDIKGDLDNDCRTYVLQPVENDRVLWHLDIKGDSIIVYLDQKHLFMLKEALYNWLRSEAKEYLSKRTEELSISHSIQFSKVTIRDQRTRWGSCSSKKNINLNWKLIMAPSDIIDYVIIHELCHIKEMNHSQGFWSLVQTYIPDYVERRKWLKMNGKKLVIPEP